PTLLQSKTYTFPYTTLFRSKNYTEAVQNLQPLAGQKENKEYPFIVYYLGLSKRGLGIGELAQAAAKPQEAVQRKQAAQNHFTQRSEDTRLNSSHLGISYAVF